MSACSVPTYVKPRFDTSRRRQLFPCKLANTEIHDPGLSVTSKKSRLVATGFFELALVLACLDHVASGIVNAVIRAYDEAGNVIEISAPSRAGSTSKDFPLFRTSARAHSAILSTI